MHIPERPVVATPGAETRQCARAPLSRRFANIIVK
jgi:hypothetical protein